MKLDCAFLFVDTYGLPLGMVIDQCESKGLQVDLHKFVTDAISHGWTHRKALSKVREALVEKQGPKQIEIEMEILRYETESH